MCEILIEKKEQSVGTDKVCGMRNAINGNKRICGKVVGSLIASNFAQASPLHLQTYDTL